MAEVHSKNRQFTAEHPLGRETDLWSEFREIEVLKLEWEQTYYHSLGKYSKFFLELENKRFLGTKCGACGKVWAPPRPLCPDCLQITSWEKLSGRGEVASFSIIHFAPSMASHLEAPYILVYVRLEGADTLFAHILKNVDSLEDVHIGMPVQVVYSEGPVEHPIHLMAFEPAA